MKIKKIKTKITCQVGAMDKVLVTLLLVVVGIGALVAIESWSTAHKDDLKNRSENSIKNILK